MSLPQRYPLQLVDRTPDSGAALAESEVTQLGEAGGLRMVLKNTLIAVLRGHVEEGVRALPRVGAEVGGLLVGPRGEPGGRMLVDEAVPIATEYRFGPSYHLSLPDLSRLAEAVAAVESDPARTIVGCYRSKTRREPGLRTVDLELLQTLEQMYSAFAADFRLFVVLTPENRLDLSAGAHVRTGKKWSTLAEVRLTARIQTRPDSIVELPERRPKELHPPPPIPEGAAPPTQPVAAAPPAPIPVAADPVGPNAVADSASESKPRGAGRRVWWYAATVVVVAAGTFVAGLWMNSGPQAVPKSPQMAPPASVALGLSATRQGATWKLAWNPRGIAALLPATGVLTARTGAAVVELPLTAQDLAGGTVLSSAHGSDILFVLRIDAPGKSALEERVRVLDPNAMAQEKASPVGTAPAQPRAAPPRTAVRSQELTVKEREAPVPTVAASEIPPAPPVTRELPPASSNAPAIDLPAPLAPQSRAAAAPAPEVPAPAVRQPSNAAPPLERARPTPASPAPVVASPASYQPPRPLRQVNATKPPLASLSSPIEIKVRVEVDARGKVTKAVAVNRSATNSRFADSAVVAARFWQFEPARENGRAIAGEATVSFRFTP
ncbi:MAG: TonB family protein [Acidobacteriia bacterium]|nr:TonB family protein [Terriglobia bacterium]